MTREEGRFKQLVQRAFGGADGQELLRELHLSYPGKFDENALVMARNCGEADLVRFLQSIVDEK